MFHKQKEVIVVLMIVMRTPIFDWFGYLDQPVQHVCHPKQRKRAVEEKSFEEGQVSRSLSMWYSEEDAHIHCVAVHQHTSSCSAEYTDGPGNEKLGPADSNEHPADK